MIRFALLFALTTAGNVALACGGAECGDSCKMKSEVELVDLSTVDGAKASFDVAGMKCGKCAAKIRTALLEVDGVKAANILVEEGKAEIAYDAGKVSPEKLLEIISGAGPYQVTPAKPAKG